MSRKLFEKPLALMQNIRFRTGSLESQLMASVSSSDRSDSTADSEDGKEVDNRIGDRKDKSLWYISTDSVPVTNPEAVPGSERFSLVNYPGKVPTTSMVAITTCDPLSSLTVSLLEKPPRSPEKRVCITKIQPKGTIAYEVAGRDSLESIAAHHDTTPSELKKLNRLVSRMIFPGQVLFIADPDYVSSSDPEPSSPELSISPPSLSPPPDTRMRIDIPLVKMADRPPSKVPGHVERQSSVVSNKDANEGDPPVHKISVKESHHLDQECYERFIKIHVKHITDGQGVVTGTLIVTPNAVMFDPNVSDPLVIEHTAEAYGMITPMDMVISAAMYHDIAAMRLRGKNSDDPTSSKPEIYHNTSCPLFHSLAAAHNVHRHVETTPTPPEPPMTADNVDSSTPEPTRSTTIESLDSEVNSVCSCGVLTSPDYNGNRLGEEEMGAVKSKEVSDKAGGDYSLLASGVDGLLLDENDNTQGVGNATSASVAKEGEAACAGRESYVAEDEGFSDDANVSADMVSRKASGQDVDQSTTDTSDLCQVSFSMDEKRVSSLTETNVNDEKRVSSLTEPNVNDEKKVSSSTETTVNTVIVNDATTGETSTDSTLCELRKDSESKTEHVSKTDQVDNIDEDPVFESENDVPVFTPIQRNSELKYSARSVVSDSSSTVKESVVLSNETSAFPPPSYNLQSQAIEQSDGSFRPFHTSAKHLSNFVNYATGLFRKESDDRINVDDINEVIMTSSDRKPVLALRSVESAIKLEDKPELFQTFDKLVARPAVRLEDPPLYLCLRVGHPKNREVSQTCPIESFRANKKKPEYWFSIPRDKVDQLYAFFVQWTPEIYGDEEEMDPETRGFVVISEEEQLEKEEHLQIVDEHFASIQKIRKDWEIISKEEAIRRMSTIDIEEPQLPDMVGETKILSDEQRLELSQNMPARTIGYSWTLIYSTDVHGFSLKTLYRDMCDIDSPILLVVTDTPGNVFGAVTNCALKMSDHFYGTGECFLYTFYPEFKVFHWTGDNNFFIKGNKESLSIGSGQGQFGLWLDGDLYHGRSHRCETFDNDVLTDREDFVLKGLEAWAFV